MNIFEGITKEKFIEEFNKEDKGILSLLHINLAFDYVNLKKEVDKYNNVKLFSITDINNYENEIQVFNSFRPFANYGDKPVLIIDNYNKYLSHRGKLENKVEYRMSYPIAYSQIYILHLGRQSNSDNCIIFKQQNQSHIVFYNESIFKRFLKVDYNIKTGDSIQKELDKLIDAFSEKILLVLADRFIGFDDKGYFPKFKVYFEKFEEVKERREFLPSHLKRNIFFDKFKIYLDCRALYDAITNFKSSPLIDDYLSLINEFLNTMQEVGDSLECEVTMNSFTSFTFKKRR